MKPGRIVLLAVFLLAQSGCISDNTPPEAGLVQKQDQALLRAGAVQYCPDEYSFYRASVNKATSDLDAENARLFFLRDYSRIQSEFAVVLTTGEELAKRLEAAKADDAKSRIKALREKIEKFRNSTLLINEGRFARKDMIRAELVLAEADHLAGEKKFQSAEMRLKEAEGLLASAEGRILPILNRYKDRDLIEKWRSWVKDTLAESRAKGSMVIIIGKADQRLKVYNKGILFKTYQVGLGSSGSLDKLHAGDNATPEGRYRIKGKNPGSRYHKALLLDYPNEDDKKRFAEARGRGLVPQSIGIGGLIEIHGGGKDAMTYGCVAMDNGQMDDLYRMAGVGTPVTIVGTEDYENRISEALGGH